MSAGTAPTDQTELPDADAAGAPSLLLQLQEWRALVEFAQAAHVGVLPQWPRGDGHPVLIIPGFLTTELSTRFLRRTLRELGYYAHDWQGGRNLGPRRETTKALRDRLESLADSHGRRVSIVGWSLGGVFARELGRSHPDDVRQVITMGSPIRGNPRASTPYQLYQLLNPRARRVDPVADAARLAREEPLEVPTTCIYSRTDGVVAWECCTSRPSPTTENVEVHSTHCGFRHNLETLSVIADRLAQPEGQWRPYHRTGIA
ncbi:MAG: esterase/lipase family protein [Jatrophihabitans sp.]|uniref:esterase/lipase family protein n=1 Tax=Jatrophihabitans sp. TaxID=1932789 RepID=UPI003F8064F2